MSKPHELEISIDRRGEVRVHIKGIKGKACLEYTEWLTQVIGPEASRVLTAEYYEPGGEVRIDIHSEARKA